jgi:hypothetical protein
MKRVTTLTAFSAKLCCGEGFALLKALFYAPLRFTMVTLKRFIMLGSGVQVPA